jgi:hypothetical protein
VLLYRVIPLETILWKQSSSSAAVFMSRFVLRGVAGVCWKRPELLGSCRSTTQHENSRPFGQTFQDIIDLTDDFLDIARTYER